MIFSDSGSLKVLVTGATGFLGEYIIKELVRDYTVLALGRNKSREAYIQSLGATFCHGDFTQKAQCETYFKNIDYVIHAGALSTIWGEWADFYASNVVGTRIVAQLAQENNVKRLIFVSSPSIYSGKEDRFNITEEQVDKKNSLNNYIKSKIMAEDVLLCEFPDLYTVIIRPRGLIGKGDPSLLPRILQANETIGIPLFNDGKNLVDITCVENVAYSLRLCIETKDIENEVFNITNAQPMEFKKILEYYFKQAQVKPNYLKMPRALMYFLASIIERIYSLMGKTTEPRVTRYTICTLGYSQTLNIEKAQRLLSYAPKITLEKGIEAYAKK